MPKHSKRIEKIPPYLFAEISRIKRELQNRGEEIIDLGIGDPDQPTPEPIVKALQDAAKKPETHRYDESARGWLPFLEAAAKWYEKRFGVSLDPSTEMLEVIGSKEGLAHLVWAFLDEDDGVLIPSPSYPVYRIQSAMCDADIYDVPLKAENNFLPKLEDIPSDVAKKAKLFFVCYPNNPTGAVADLDFYREIVSFCREYDILLIGDMAYSEVTYDGYRSPSLLQIEGAKDCVIEFHSLSKMFNMTGWRIGWACGNPDAIFALSRLKDNIDSKQFAAIAEAAAYALEHGDNTATFALYKKRRDILVDGLNALGWKIEKPKGTFYIWGPIPNGASSMEFAERLLKEAKVLVIPGTGYGKYGEGYVRMSITIPGDKDGEVVREVIERIAKARLVGATL